MPIPVKPVIGGESGVPLGVNLTTPPPMLLMTPDCEQGIQFWPLQRFRGVGGRLLLQLLGPRLGLVRLRGLR
jgi:hypothetical protein